MKQPVSTDDHVQLELGLYVLGALSPEEQPAVEEHLGRCAECRTECAELSEVSALLALLTVDDIAEIPPDVVHRRRDAVAPGSHAARPGIHVSRRTSTHAPAARWDVRTDVRRRSSRFGRKHRLALSAIGVALLVGVGAGVWLRATPTPITLAGHDTNVVTGVSMSVTVVGRDGQSHVDAKISGLRAGIQYQLYAVNVHGQTRVVSRWAAGSGPYLFSGDLRESTDDLAFFSVTQVDGGVVVTVHVAKPAL